MRALSLGSSCLVVTAGCQIANCGRGLEEASLSIFKYVVACVEICVRLGIFMVRVRLTYLWGMPYNTLDLLARPRTSICPLKCTRFVVSFVSSLTPAGSWGVGKGLLYAIYFLHFVINTLWHDLSI